MEKLKRQVKGITLIALVVTIIVLLILAGVAINLSIGNNGLFTRAQNAKIVSEQSKVLEQLRMATYEKSLELEKSSMSYIDYLKSKGIIKEEVGKVEKLETYASLDSNIKLASEEGIKYVVDVELLIGNNISTGKGNLETGDVYYILNGDLYYLDKNKEEKFIGKIFEQRGLTLGDVYTDDMIGQKLTYTSNGQSDWIVFGKDKNGNILITTKKPIDANYKVEGTAEGWLDYEENLHTACSSYGNTIQGETISSRSITLEDINYVSGYIEPEYDEYIFGPEDDNSNNKVDFLYPKKGATTTIEGEEYKNWMKATKESEEQKFKNNWYYYYKSQVEDSAYNIKKGDILRVDYRSYPPDYIPTNITTEVNVDKLKYIWGDENEMYNYIVASRAVCMVWTETKFFGAEVKKLYVETNGKYFCSSQYKSAWNNSDLNSEEGMIRPIAVLPASLLVTESEGIYDLAY